MPTPQFQNQFDPYVDWQSYAPQALGTPGQGFIPLQQANYLGQMEYQNVMNPYTQWYNALGDLEGLQANTANWAGGSTEEGGGGWGTGLLDDILIGEQFGGQANPIYGDAGWQWTGGGPNGGTGGTFGEYAYSPTWNLGGRLEAEGIEPWLAESQGGLADPNYDPASMGIDTAASYDPVISSSESSSITPSHSLFQSDDQFDYNDESQQHRNYIPGLQQALGTGTDLTGYGSTYTPQAGDETGFVPSYLETGRDSEWDAFKLPAGQGGQANQFGWNQTPLMLAANPSSGMGADAGDNMYDLQRAFNYKALQNAGVESWMGSSAEEGDPQTKMQNMVQNLALGNPANHTANEYKDALAWNRFQRDSQEALPGFQYMAPGSSLDKQGNKDAMKGYITANTPHSSDYGRSQIAQDVINNMQTYADININPGDVGYLDASTVQAGEQQDIKDWQDANIWQNKDLNPTRLKNPNISGSVGSMEQDALQNIQSAWNDPTNTESLQSRELLNRKLAQEAEMAGMQNFQDYRTDTVIGDTLSPNTLYGRVNSAQADLMQGASNIQNAYQGVGGKRPTEIQEYDDYIADKLYGTGSQSWTPQRQAKIDAYNVAVQGGGGALGFQQDMQNRIDAIHQNYLANPDQGVNQQQMNTPDGSNNFTNQGSGGGTTLEGQKLNEFAQKFTSTTDNYDATMRDLEDSYWLTADEKADTKKEAVADAAAEWRQGKRDLDLQMLDGGGETSRLRRDIRGFKGGNILSGRRNRRAEEEYGAAMMDRADLIRQQKDITEDRRRAQKTARSDYEKEMDVLNTETSTSATNLFDDAEIALANTATDVAGDLSNYQTDIQSEVYGDSTSPIKENYTLKQGLESGPGSVAEGLSNQYQDFLTDMTGDTDVNNFKDTKSDILDWKAKAMGEGFGGNKGYYGTGGLRDTYQDSLNDAQSIAETSSDDAFGYGTKSLEDVSGARNTYTSDTLGDIGKFNTIRGNERDTLHTKYKDYTNDMSGGWGADLVSKYGGGNGLISAVAGDGGKGRSGLMNKMMDNNSPWYGSPTSPNKWAPEVLWTGHGLGGPSSATNMPSSVANANRNLFGRDFAPLTAMNDTGDDYRGFHNWTIRSPESLSYGFGRSDKVPAVQPNQYWGINQLWNWSDSANNVYEVPYLKNTPYGPGAYGYGGTGVNFDLATAAVRRG